MNNTFREVYKQQHELAAGLAGRWGYHLPYTHIERHHKRKTISPPVVASIKLLKLGPDIPKTQRILKIQQEIKEMENERLLERLKKEKEFREQSVIEKNPFIRKMEQRVEEYNYIIQHKHLTERGSDRASTILGMRSRSPAEKVQKQINQKAFGLTAGSMKKQIKLSKEMAHLYREYRLELDRKRALNSLKSRTIDSQPAKTERSSLQRDISPKTIKKGLMDKTRAFNTQSSFSSNAEIDYGTLYTEANAQEEYDKYPTFEANIHNYITQKGLSTLNGWRMERDLNEPYVNQRDFESYRTMKFKIKNGNKEIEMFKDKVRECQARNTKLASLMHNDEKGEQVSKNNSNLYTSKFKYQRKEKEDQGLKESFIQSEDEKERLQKLHRQACEKIKQNELQQEHIFAELLKRKHNKFNRVNGSRMLKFYDDRKEAQALLKGQLRSLKTKSELRSSWEESLADSKIRKQKGGSLKTGLVGELQEEWRRQSKDKEHYERMCKNEKRNMMFKKR